MNDATSRLNSILHNASNIVFFGGAGVSTESGIPDFRSANGLYNPQSGAGAIGSVAPETILSHSFFLSHTETFFRFYRDKMLYPQARPNSAHAALAGLERRGVLKAIVTQNIDGLHQAAGSANVLELHGSVHRNYCMNCRRFYPLEAILQATAVPRCACGGVVKPDVVLYEEALDQDVLEQAVHAIRAAEILIVGGTSLNVYPAAGLVRYYQGSALVLINKSETPFDAQADLIIRGSIGEVLGAAVSPDC